MNSQEITVDVVCDEFPDKIELISKTNTELPQKFYVAYIDKIRSQIAESSAPNDPATAYIFKDRESYIAHGKPIRAINLLDNMKANGFSTNTEKPMLVEFVTKNKAA